MLVNECEGFCKMLGYIIVGGIMCGDVEVISEFIAVEEVALRGNGDHSFDVVSWVGAELLLRRSFSEAEAKSEM
jgi:hypothetical protein